MKHIIIGTAGHVDHGKTCLVKALTGMDTDRLKEEKTRGITIENGFAYLDFENGSRAGFVDMPGHEKFIKNMLAGAGGIDLALLTVAANEGIMPQTEEHLDILELLGIRDGLVVVTKADLVTPQQRDELVDTLRIHLKGTFLDGKPILSVSAQTGEGIPELKAVLQTLVEHAAEKDVRTPFRLPVDRVFSVEGFGTVVTGTLIEGCIRREEIVELLPSGIRARVRGLQVHGQEVPAAFAGQRVAANLAGIRKSDVRRGDTLAKPDSLCTGTLLDVRLRNLKNSARTIRSGAQLHIYHGAAAVSCRVLLLEGNPLSPGESGYAQLRLSESLPVKNGDRFVIRFFSPLETIGGGVILDAAPQKHRRGNPAITESLRIRECGTTEQRIMQALAEFQCTLPGKRKLAKVLAIESTELEPVLQSLQSRGKILEPLSGRYLYTGALDTVWAQCRNILEKYHTENPLHAGIRQAELRQKLFPSTDTAVGEAILGLLLQEGKLRQTAQRIALWDFEIRLTKRQEQIQQRILSLYRQAGLEPPALREVQRGFSTAEQEDYRRVMESLFTTGRLIRLSPQLACDRTALRKAAQTAAAWFSCHETLKLAEYRDALGTTRKYALEFLEYFDRNRLTKKVEDVRRSGDLPFDTE